MEKTTGNRSSLGYYDAGNIVLTYVDVTYIEFLFLSTVLLVRNKNYWHGPIIFISYQILTNSNETNN